MKFGFLTNSLVQVGVKDLDSIAGWAVANGFNDLEIGPTIPLDEELFFATKKKHNIDISTFIYCRNFLSSDKEQANTHVTELVKRIEFAAKVGATKVVATTGVSDASYNNGHYHPEASLEGFKRVFEPIVDLAEEHNIDILFEVCPFMGNVSISPYMWDLVFDTIQSKRLGIAYDPSHLVWEMIEPYSLIIKYKDRIKHVHGKDCELNYDALKQNGILHMFDLTARGENDKAGKKKFWWRYRLPGLGELDWGNIVSKLYEIGYDGTISIEHEDPIWHGTEDKVKRGIIASKEHIKQFIF